MLRNFHRLPMAFKVWRLHRKSGLFDFEWYLRRNPDVRAAGKRPFLHFVMHGIFEGRAPNPDFQAHAYSAAHPEVSQSGLSPLQHYVLHGGSQKGPVRPSEATRSIAPLQNALPELEEENALLLEQLHSVQEELETYFLKNKTLESEKSSLVATNAELVKEAQEREAALDAANKNLFATKARAAEAEKMLADLASEKNTLSNECATLAKEHDLRTKERDSLANEHDHLKAIASERASRIAELEAQVADQAQRQKLIDEQLIRAETQLEMLKEFLQPLSR